MALSTINESLVKYSEKQPVSSALTAQKNTKGRKGAQALDPLKKAGTSRDEDYLNSILPPREFTEGGTLYVRYVSPKPATKQDVSNLIYDFKEALEKRSARLSGICTIREELYS